ncbi:hypothetical protein [Arthrobacter psychrochitiniphilus]|uniref:hypothetical protein n=1 Tax=Arthrobacter psychrochitiniphilus TaxID=291045 RepID=UPI003F7BBDD6
MAQDASTLWKLNKNYGSTDSATLVQLQPFQGMGHYSSHCRRSADRLVASHCGQPQDDEILMPFLTLYRQAYELSLKDLALCIAAHQVRFGVESPNYSKKNMDVKIGAGNGNFGHNLHRSFAWVSREIGELDLTDEKLPQELSLAVDLLHNIDPSGTTFRYPDRDLKRTLNLDFSKLSADLAGGIDWLWAVYTQVDEMLSAAPSASEYW